MLPEKVRGPACPHWATTGARTQRREVVMIWLSHSKYTHEYVSGQLAEMCVRMRRETRRMVYVASAAVGLMAAAQATYLYGLLGV